MEIAWLDKLLKEQNPAVQLPGSAVSVRFHEPFHLASSRPAGRGRGAQAQQVLGGALHSHRKDGYATAPPLSARIDLIRTRSARRSALAFQRYVPSCR